MVRLTGSQKTKKKTKKKVNTNIANNKKNRNEHLKLEDEFSESLGGAFVVNTGLSANWASC